MSRWGVVLHRTSAGAGELTVSRSCRGLVGGVLSHRTGSGPGGLPVSKDR